MTTFFAHFDWPDVSACAEYFSIIDPFFRLCFQVELDELAGFPGRCAELSPAVDSLPVVVQVAPAHGQFVGYSAFPERLAIMRTSAGRSSSGVFVRSRAHTVP